MRALHSLRSNGLFSANFILKVFDVLRELVFLAWLNSPRQKNSRCFLGVWKFSVFNLSMLVGELLCS